MKFDFIIGNPPYQETKGGTKNVDIWPDFVKECVKNSDTTCLIHPGRWVIPKKQMKSVQDMMIKSGLKEFNLYPSSDNVFSNLRGVDGGITITYFNKGYKGNIRYAIENKSFGVFNSTDKFFSNCAEKEIYEIFWNKYVNSIESRIRGSVGSLGSTEFGYDKPNNISQLCETDIGMKEPIHIWAAKGFGKSTRYCWNYIEKSNLGKIPIEVISTRKVLLSKVGVPITVKKAVGFNGIPQILEKNAIGENVFLIIPETDTDYDLQLIKSLFMTKTVRFLMSITQKDLYVRGFENIPDYVYFKPLLKGQLFTDEFFYKTFNFSQELIDYIESHVSPKTEKE